MMKKIAVFLVVSTLGFGMTLSELSKKMDGKVNGFKSTDSVLSMTLINSNGEKSLREMRLMILEEGVNSKSLIEFLSPSDVKGTKLLTYVNDQKDNDQWLYLPSIKRVKRIVGKGKGGSFMGSEFTYEDFGKQGSEKYRYDEALTEETYDGVACYKGTRYPLESDSAYSKHIIYVEKETYLVKRIDYYDPKGVLLKIATFEDYKKTGERYRVGKIVMKNVQNEKSTVIEWVKDKVFANLKQKDFDKRVLKR